MRLHFSRLQLFCSTHHPALLPLTVWSDLPAGLHSFLHFGRFSARISRINPRVSGRWAGSRRPWLFDFDSFTQPTGKSCQPLQHRKRRSLKHQELKENKHPDRLKQNVDCPTDKRRRTAFIGRTTRGRWERTGGSDQDNQDGGEDIGRKDETKQERDNQIPQQILKTEKKSGSWPQMKAKRVSDTIQSSSL